MLKFLTLVVICIAIILNTICILIENKKIKKIEHLEREKNKYGKKFKKS